MLGSTEKQLRLREVKALDHRDASADPEWGLQSLSPFYDVVQAGLSHK